MTEFMLDPEQSRRKLFVDFWDYWKSLDAIRSTRRGFLEDHPTIIILNITQRKNENVPTKPDIIIFKRLHTKSSD
jgi:hypothetical protein